MNSPPLVTGVLLSGGLDSSILLADWARQGLELQPIYIRSDLFWQPAELAAAREFLQAIHGPNVRPLVLLDQPLRDLYQNHWSVSGKEVPNATSADAAVFLPGRNALLSLKAALWCQLNNLPRLALAPLGTSPFQDAREPFFRNFQAALNCGDLPEVEILRPFAGFTKRQVMELGSEFPLALTSSCIAPRASLHCGQCNKCAERRAAFAEVGLADVTRYASPAKETC